MTSEEESEFLKFGCVSRSIIKLCELRNIPISADDFVDRFRDKFDPNHFGALHVDGFCFVVRDLQLCGSVAALRDIELIKQFLGQSSLGIFLLTDRRYDFEHLFHTRLVLGMAKQGEEEGLIVSNPIQDGRVVDHFLSFESLERQLAHFLLLQT